MDPDFAPMLVSTVLIIVSGAVILLRPISKRLGVFLEVLAEERRRAAGMPQNHEHLLATLESLDRRLTRLEERQEFTEALLLHRETPQLSRQTDARPPSTESRIHG